MNKNRWTIPFTAFLLLGVAGCGNDNNRTGVNETNHNPLRPVGYYSNENHPDNGNPLFRDNDGPVTEWMDHTLGDEDQLYHEQQRKMLQTRDENGHPVNPTKPLAETDRNFFQRDNRFSTSDINYHGHLNRNIANTGSYVDDEYQEDVTDAIRNKVEDVDNVRSIRSVAYGNTVWISVNLRDQSKAAVTTRAIQKAVRPIVKGKTIRVISDEGAIGRDRNINNDIPQRQAVPQK